MPPRERLVGHQREGVDVVLRGRLLAEEHLLAGVGRRERAERVRIEPGLLAFPLAGVGGVGRRTRDAEVEHLRQSRFRDEDVPRLEIGMHDAVGVRVGERRSDVVNDAARHAAG